MSEIYKALVKFQGAVKPIEKNSENPYFSSKYASLDCIINEIRPTLAECKLGFLQLIEPDLNLKTIIFHENGETIESTSDILVNKQNDAQAMGSGVTYAKRYNLCAALGLSIEDEDDDGNGASEGEPEKQVNWLNVGSEDFKKAYDFVKGETDKGVAIAKLRKRYGISNKTKEALLK